MTYSKLLHLCLFLLMLSGIELSASNQNSSKRKPSIFSTETTPVQVGKTPGPKKKSSKRSAHLSSAERFRNRNGGRGRSYSLDEARRNSLTSSARKKSLTKKILSQSTPDRQFLTRSATWSTPLDGRSRPHVKLAFQKNGETLSVLASPRFKPTHCYECQHGFYEKYETDYDTYLEELLRTGVRKRKHTVGECKEFALRTKAFVLVANFLEHKGRLVSDYSSPRVRETLLQDLFYSENPQFREIVRTEGKLYICKRYFDQLHHEGLIKVAFATLSNDSEPFVTFIRRFRETSVRNKSKHPELPFINLDHVIPKAGCGANTLRNAALISAKLNRAKSDHRTPELEALSPSVNSNGSPFPLKPQSLSRAFDAAVTAQREQAQPIAVRDVVQSEEKKVPLWLKIFRETKQIFFRRHRAPSTRVFSPDKAPAIKPSRGPHSFPYSL